jgi:hypothetical protein
MDWGNNIQIGLRGITFEDIMWMKLVQNRIHLALAVLSENYFVYGTGFHILYPN